MSTMTCKQAKKNKGTYNKGTKILCLKMVQNGKVFYSGVFKPSNLKNHTYIDHFSTEMENINPLGNGYQRIRNPKQIENFSIDISSGKVCPPPIILNDRGFMCQFKPIGDKYSNLGYLYIPYEYKLPIVDGQLRTLSILQALEDCSDIENNFELFVVISQTDKVEEINNFLIINDKQTHTKKSLKYRLNYIKTKSSEFDISEQDSNIYSYLNYPIVLKLRTETNSILNNMFTSNENPSYKPKEIKLDPKKEKYRRITESNFIKSMDAQNIVEYYCNNILKETESPEEKVFYIYKDINVFWTELKKITNPMWEKPKYYKFFDIIGVGSCMKLFKNIIEKLHENNKKISNENIRFYLEGIPLLKNYTKWYNTTGAAANSLSFQEIEGTFADFHGSHCDITTYKRHIEADFNKINNKFLSK